MQSGWAFGHWKPWVVLERMAARSVSHGRQQFVLCFRHGLAKPRELVLGDNLSNGKTVREALEDWV